MFHELVERDDGEPHFCALCLTEHGEEIMLVWCLTCREWLCLHEERHHHSHHPCKHDRAKISFGEPSTPIPN